jgi:hypothetical protein
MKNKNVIIVGSVATVTVAMLILAVVAIAAGNSFRASQTNDTAQTQLQTTNTQQTTGSDQQNTGSDSQSTDSNTSSNSSSGNSDSNAASVDSNVSYQDGTYTASNSYSVPHGETCAIETTVTIKNGVVTAVKNSHTAVDHHSVSYQEWFENAIQTAAVGKKLADVASLSRVGGASLTTDAFKQAVVSISSKAAVNNG